MLRKTMSTFVAIYALLGACAGTQSAETVDLASTAATWTAPVGGERYIAVISDLHAGIGQKPDRTWYPTDDFRWETELEAFLDAVSARGNDRVDLLVAGDLLELWQPPSDIPCSGVSAGLGCTVDEMRTITERVLGAHPKLTATLRRFADRGQNRLHIIPGNHDSAVLLATVWKPLSQALGAGSGRVNLVISGVWQSQDGSVVIEHGHQIGADVNRYDTWPEITRTVGFGVYVVRPWGERFVQKLFNEQEAAYPIIDNLSPEAAGARYRMANRGLWKSASDLARFLMFNLVETSFAQKAAFLGVESAVEATPNEARGRALGHKLFVTALSVGDPFAQELMADNPESAALRNELDAMLRDEARITKTEVLLLCDQAAQRGKPVCVPPTLGYVSQKLLVPRERVMLEHLRQRLKDYPRMRTFIYGHTHELEQRWPVRVNDLISVDVLNSGAFQRVVDEKGYLARVRAKGLTPAEGLSKLDLGDLPPCYTSVLLAPAPGAKPETVRWLMPAGGTGTFVTVGDARCK
jgi:UDP-2,3-diacylglucosamine pyrophosphatase LpxH